MWSTTAKVIVWIELTSPWEELADLRNIEKKTRYYELSSDIRDRDWRVHEIAVEVGCRGHIGSEGWNALFKLFGINKPQRKTLKERVEETARHCSHTIFAHRRNHEWVPRKPLDVEKWYQRGEGKRQTT